MKEIVVNKREDEKGGMVMFTFRFKTLGQLLDEDVPDWAPGKELTDGAEEAIAGHIDEYRVKRPASVVIELPEPELAATPASGITDAVRHHFTFRQDDLTHDLKISLREGMYSIILMLVNIVLLLGFFAYITVNEIPVESLIVIIIFAFLTILNWATIWDTYEHFVYDHRNLARKRKIFRKITGIPITVRGY
ncbi:hypothetical protein J2741_000334 [Methanolinea mesophila]|uniref:hypothetical protein n=1 Tax=Methanolinea mesophila TaxID=547055 RepID=UPI001AE5537C|nr:hypothetical protein [Methanolinea mesophila]MBP1927787.1 hypothetical protein [Methanolinea mesophila]